MPAIALPVNRAGAGSQSPSGRQGVPVILRQPPASPPNRDTIEDEIEDEDERLSREALPRPRNQGYPAVDDHREERQSKGGLGGGKPPRYAFGPRQASDSERERRAEETQGRGGPSGGHCDFLTDAQPLRPQQPV